MRVVLASEQEFGAAAVKVSMAVSLGIGANKSDIGNRLNLG